MNKMEYKTIDINKLINDIKNRPEYNIINIPQNLLAAYECIFGDKEDNILNLNISADQAERINNLIFTSMELIAYKTLMPNNWPEYPPKDITPEEWQHNLRQLLFRRLTGLEPIEYRHYLEIAIHKAFYDRDKYLKEHDYRTRKAKKIRIPKINAIWCMPFSRITQMRRWFYKEYDAMPEDLKAAAVFFLIFQLITFPPREQIKYARLVLDIECMRASLLTNRKNIIGAAKSAFSRR